MATFADIEALGYKVGESQPGVFFVSGFGHSTYVKADDQAQIDSLADPVVHADLVAQFENGPPLTALATTPVEAVAALDPATATVADIIDAMKTAL